MFFLMFYVFEVQQALRHPDTTMTHPDYCGLTQVTAVIKVKFRAL